MIDYETRIGRWLIDLLGRNYLYIMSFIKKVHIETDRTNPYPYDVPAIKFAKQLDLSASITFVIGDNGAGKSTLLETLAYRMQLPHMDGSDYEKKAFNAAKRLAPFLDIEFEIHRTVGFFFRAEDFGDLMNSTDRSNTSLFQYFKSLEGDIPDKVIQEMSDSANTQKYHMRKDFGQDLDTFSHGEAYLHIMQEKLKHPGIYILDEPEAALSPSKQLSLIYQIKSHLADHMSQFIIATHSPMLMATPGATIYEVTEEGMKKTPLEETEHYTITKSFLNNPEAYLRHL